MEAKSKKVLVGLMLGNYTATVLSIYQFDASTSAPKLAAIKPDGQISNLLSSPSNKDISLNLSGKSKL